MRQSLRGAPVRAVPHARRGLVIVPGSGRPVLNGKTIPAPWKGWDASAPISDMDEAAAIILDNWFPEPAFVRLRRGHVEHANGLGTAPVESLMAYHGPSATQKLFAACGDSIYDVTSSGTIGAAAVSGLTSARWQHINFTTPGGNFLYIVNGADAPRHFNGTTWATPSITGITASDAIHVNAHKQRIWFVLKNSTKAAYLPVSSIAGAANVFDLGPLMTRGGYLNAMATWTMDSGWGPDDFAVFITSRGQAIVYAGNDPASVDDWALKGVYDLGAPIGRRCFTKVGGDLALISIDGVVPLSQALVVDRGAVRKTAITGRIQRALNEAAISSGANFGWQLIAYPKGTAAILNVPITEGGTSHQYVMNTLTGSWCRYLGQDAMCWEIFQDRLFFGGKAGKVYEADRTGRDNGNIIVADMKTAFNYFGGRGINKRFSMIRPLLTSDGQITPVLTLNTDYRDVEPATVASTFTSNDAKWDEETWDDFQWGGGASTIADWIAVNDTGHCAAVRMKVAVAASNPTADVVLQLNGFDIVLERGAFL